MFNMAKFFKNREKQSSTPFAVMSISSMFNSMFSVSAPSAMHIGSVYACIRMISDSVAMTPLSVYKKGTSGRDVLPGALESLLKNPAKNVTSFQFQNAMLGQLVGWGNAYSVIEYSFGTPKSLIFIPAEKVQIVETFSTLEPYFYRVMLNDGNTVEIFPDEMLHYRNITLDGYTGLSPIALHSSTFDRGFYEGEFATNFMKRGGSMSGIVTTEKKLRPEQITQLKEDFSTAYGGAENAGRTPVLGDGLKYQQLKPISPADADYVKSKELTKAEIMEIFKVPPPLLGVIDATYNNTEQLALIYQRYTLNPIYEMIQQELTLKLVSSSERESVYVEFAQDALLNATAADKAEVITKLTEKGVMTLNEARQKYNLKDVKGLDEVILPLNLAPITLHSKVLTPKEECNEPTNFASENTSKEEDTLEIKNLEKQLHKMQSEFGRIKKTLGNG